MEIGYRMRRRQGRRGREPSIVGRTAFILQTSVVYASFTGSIVQASLCTNTGGPAFSEWPLSVQHRYRSRRERFALERGSQIGGKRLGTSSPRAMATEHGIYARVSGWIRDLINIRPRFKQEFDDGHPIRLGPDRIIRVRLRGRPDCSS
jgi:hypothetical protein